MTTISSEQLKARWIEDEFFRSDHSDGKVLVLIDLFDGRPPKIVRQLDFPIIHGRESAP